jgi:hypothetical protein
MECKIVLQQNTSTANEIHVAFKDNVFPFDKTLGPFSCKGIKTVLFSSEVLPLMFEE